MTLKEFIETKDKINMYSKRKYNYKILILMNNNKINQLINKLNAVFAINILKINL